MSPAALLVFGEMIKYWSHASAPAGSSPCLSPGRLQSLKDSTWWTRKLTVLFPFSSVAIRCRDFPRVCGGMLSGGSSGNSGPTAALEISWRAPVGPRSTDPGELRQVCGRSGDCRSPTGPFFHSLNRGISRLPFSGPWKIGCFWWFRCSICASISIL
jgi:hypothetical protein